MRPGDKQDLSSTDAVSDSGQDLEANEAASNKGYTQVVAKVRVWQLA